MSTLPSPSSAAYTSEDEYDRYDFSEFTEQDLQYDFPHSGGPSATIELEAGPNENSQYEEMHVNVDKGKKRAAIYSPLEEFRSGILSVTDLVSPVWCEVQFDYGLRGKRNRRIESRPPTFSSKYGKTITVEAKVAESNNIRTKQGLAVHKELERELRYEEISVNITTDEERWALRIIHMIDSVNSLLELGIAREMPVFGMIHGHVCVGIIDEIHRSDFDAVRLHTKGPSVEPPTIPITPQKLPSSQTSLLSSLERELVAAVIPAAAVQDPPKHLLRILDTKTRRTNSLPKDEDTVQSRLQLMCYHRLLTNLVRTDASRTASFDFTEIWARVGPSFSDSALFSQRFKTQAGLIGDDFGDINCLRDLAALWSKGVSRLDIVQVDNSLQLVYRLNARSSARTAATAPTVLTASQQEEADIAKAIDASIRDMEDTNEIQSEPPPVQTIEAHEIIGTKEFELDEPFLDDHLARVLSYWHGEREPVGVEIQNSGRCFSCEYCTDCEWRETKAGELAQAAQLRKKSREW